MKKSVIVVIVVLVLVGAAAMFLIKPSNPVPTPVVYESIEINTLFDALKDDILVAGEYKDKFVEVSGNVCLIRSDENYVNISIPDNSLIVFCKATSAEQNSFVTNCAIGDAIAVRGKVVKVESLSGYTIEVDEFIGE